MDLLHDVVQLHDSSYYFLGTSSSTQGNKKVQILKTDIYGDTIWTKKYADNFYNDADCMIPSGDSNLIFVGSVRDSSTNSDILFTKIDTSGNVLFKKSFGGQYLNAAQHVEQTNDNGYIISGYSQNSTLGNGSKLYIAKTDSLGNPIRTKSYKSHNFVNGNWITQTTEGSYIITGNEEPPGANSNNYLYLYKIDSLGNEIWKRTYGGNDLDYGVCVKQTFDKGFIVSGLNTITGAKDQQAYLLKTNRRGVITRLTPEKKKKRVKIYPNPTTGKFTIESREMIKIEIFDLQGKKLYSHKPNNNTYQIDLHGMSNSIYFVKVNTQNGSFVEKIIKK